MDARSRMVAETGMGWRAVRLDGRSLRCGMYARSHTLVAVIGIAMRGLSTSGSKQPPQPLAQSGGAGGGRRRSWSGGNYDVIVIGAGPVGENVADRVRRGRLSVAVVESELVGDEYSYWACAPSKALLHPPAAVAAARAVDGARQAVTGELAAEAVLARRPAAPFADLGSGQGAGAARRDRPRARHAGVLLRGAFTLAAADQREHQRAAAPVLP